MIRFDKVDFSYENGHKVLHDLSFHIKKGEQVGLIGANGAGKSTLMKALLCLIRFEGQIEVDGIKVQRDNLSEVRRKVGYVLQDSDNQMFMPSVLEDMIFGPVNYGMSREEAEKLAENTLKELDLEYLKNRKNYKISGGEKRMAAIATILAMQPEVMLMDEPTTALDPQNRRQLIRVVNSLPMTKLIASHDLDFILETCDRVILISDGTIAADAGAREILWNKQLLEQHHLELPYCLAGIPERWK